jgi:hypothetical protein
MARTLIAAVSPPLAQNASYFPTTPLTALSAAVALTALDAVNFNYTPIISGKTMLHVYNTDASSHTITIHSVADPQGRTGDITAYSIPAAASGVPGFAMFGPFTTSPNGWNQASPAGLWFDGNSALLFALVLTNP